MSAELYNPIITLSVCKHRLKQTNFKYLELKTDELADFLFVCLGYEDRAKFSIKKPKWMGIPIRIKEGL